VYDDILGVDSSTDAAFRKLKHTTVHQVMFAFRFYSFYTASFLFFLKFVR